MTEPNDFWADENEVLLHKRTREIWHVMKRLNDVDNDSSKYPEAHRHYELQDETHTTNQHWCEEDLEDCFAKIGVTVIGKPVQADEMEYWYD